MHRRKFDKNFYLDTLWLLIHSGSFLKAAREVFRGQSISCPIISALTEICYSYYDEFNEPIGRHIESEWYNRVDSLSDADKKLWNEFLEEVLDTQPPNEAYILSRIRDFETSKHMEASLKEAAKILSQGRIEETQEKIQEAGRLNIVPIEEKVLVEPPEDDNGDPTFYQHRYKKIVCPFGIDLIDRRIRGIPLGLTSVFGSYKAGKSWFLLYLANQGFVFGKKVLFVSHELSAEECQCRWYMMWSNCTNHIDDDGNPRTSRVEFTRFDENGKIVPDSVEYEERDTVYNPEVVVRARQDMSRYSGQILMAKYPMGTCTVGEIERLMNSLEVNKGFKPDILISDYVEKMRLDSDKEERHAINKAYINFKRIADEREIAVVTASQIKLQYSDWGVIPDKGLPTEDARKLGNVDLGITIASHPSTEDLCVVYIAINRTGSQKFGCICSRKLEVGHVVGETWPLPTGDDQVYRGRNRRS